MKSVIILAVVAFSCVSSQRGPFGKGPFGRGPPGGPPKCADDSKPTCTCANGDVITRPRPNPCGDRTKPTCVCADGSSPVKRSLCKDGNKPTCAGGVAPVCQDGSALNTDSFPPCSDGPPKCADGGTISCADGTPIPPFISRLVG